MYSFMLQSVQYLYLLDGVEAPVGYCEFRWVTDH